MHFRHDQQSRLRPSKLGDGPALIRISRGLEDDPSNDPSGDSEFPDDAITRKRRLLAMFCKTLGERLGGDPMPANSTSPPSVLTQPLSPRQRQTLELLLAGNAEKQIAARLAISRHTVHVYVKSLYKCFGVCSRAELLARWVQR